MIWYWSGVFVVLCVAAVVLCCMGRDRGKVALSNVLVALLISAFSWVMVGVAIIIAIVILISEADNIVIWRSNKKE